MKFHAMGLVSFANQVSEFPSENFFERERFFSDDYDFEFALAQRRRHFQPDEARPDHHRALCVFRPRDDAPAIGESSQITNVRQVIARN